MRHRAFLVSGLIAVAGCPDKNRPARTFELATERLAAFADEMCRCTDKACADRVQDAVTKWGTAKAGESTAAHRQYLDEHPEVMTKMTEIGARFGECMSRAMSATGSAR